jgi:hypothetical protein
VLLGRGVFTVPHHRGMSTYLVLESSLCVLQSSIMPLPDDMRQPVRAAELEVSANVRAEVARRQRSYADVAASIGMDARIFGRSARGERPWQLDELVAVALTLDVPLIELFRFREPRRQETDQ